MACSFGGEVSEAAIQTAIAETAAAATDTPVPTAVPTEVPPPTETPPLTATEASPVGKPATATPDTGGDGAALIVLYNDTLYDLCHLYISPPTGDGPVDDLVGPEGMIPSGYPHTIFDIPPGDYDLRVEDCEGNLVAGEYGVSLSGKIPWAVPGSIGDSGISVEEGVVLTLVNDTLEEVCLVWAGRPASEWSADVLDDATIPAGDSLEVLFPPGTWALMAQDCSGADMAYEASYDVTSDTEWHIGP
jgi:hypothetical protein